MSATHNMNMKKNKDKQYYLRRAKVGFKTLVIYHCVTKPQYEKAYHKNGKFSKAELIKQMNFLSSWDGRSKREKEILAYKCAMYSKTFNYTFGIPRKLVADVLGFYYDPVTRKRQRISIEEVVKPMLDDGTIVRLNHGTKGNEDADGNYKVKAYWTNKYKLGNKNYWLKLLDDKCYSDYTKYPMDDEGFVLRAIQIIAKYRKSKYKKTSQEPAVANNSSNVKIEQKPTPVAPVEKKNNAPLSKEEIEEQIAKIWQDLRAKKIWNLLAVLDRFKAIGVTLNETNRKKVEAHYAEIRYGVKPPTAA